MRYDKTNAQTKYCTVKDKEEECGAFSWIEHYHFNQLYVLNFFRGVLPLGQRARLWEKHRARSRKQQRGHSSNTPQDLQAGQSVTMKNAPMYQPGAIGEYFFLFIGKFNYLKI